MSAILPITPNLRVSGPYTATAGQTVFSYNFPVQLAEDVLVRRTRDDETVELVRGIDYAITGIFNPAGGAIVLADEAEEDDEIEIRGHIVLTRTSSVAREGRFKSRPVDDDLDRIVMAQQEIRRDMLDLALGDLNVVLATDQDAVDGVGVGLTTAAQVRKAIEGLNFLITGAVSPSDLPDLIARHGLTPYDCGAVGAGAEESGCFNAMIDRLISNGGGTAIIPPAQSGHDWRVGLPIVMHKSGHAGSYLNFYGLGDKVRIARPGTTGDAFQIGDGTNPIYYVQIANVYLYSPDVRVSGIDFRLIKANKVKLSNIVTDGTYYGLYGEDLNTVYGERIDFNMPNQTNGAGLKVFSDPGGSGRTDIVKFDELTVQAYNAGSTGMIIEGRVAGFHADGAYMLGVERGLQLVSESDALADIPQFCDFNKLEVDRATDCSLALDKGYRTEFRRCDLSNTSGAMDVPYPQGSEDGTTAQINEGAIDTKITAGRIGNSQEAALAFAGDGLRVVGTTFNDASKAGVGDFPLIYIGATAKNFAFQSALCEGYDRTSHAFSIESGANTGWILDTSYKDMVTGFNNGTGTNVTISGQKEAP